MFNLNTVNSLHSYIKETYNHYWGVATKYINRYNALFSYSLGGGHGFKALEELEMIEIKQGSYAGDADKVRFVGINDDEVIYK